MDSGAPGNGAPGSVGNNVIDSGLRNEEPPSITTVDGLVTALGGEDAAEANGNTVTLKKDVDQSQTAPLLLAIENVTLNLGGKTITGVPGAPVIGVMGGSLTVTGTGTITSAPEAPVIIVMGGSLTVTGGTIKAGESAGTDTGNAGLDGSPAVKSPAARVPLVRQPAATAELV